MDVYSVVSSQLMHCIDDNDFFTKNDLNILYKFDRNAHPSLEPFQNANILIDSAAYYFNSRDSSKTADATRKFIDKYKEFIKETRDDDRIVGYFDMDLLYLPLHKIRSVRQELQELTDNIIPVYHPAWGENEFKKMCDEYDYIAFATVGDYKVEEYLPFVRYAHKQGCMVHGLGMNRNKVMRAVPFNSVDSAHWVREVYVAYYTNHNIEKNTENNKKYQTIYTKKEIITQMQRQLYYTEYWHDYMSGQKFKLKLNQRKK